MKQKKVVKTFTVDEGVYDWLVETLKKADIGIGVSNLLDAHLKYISQGLRGVLSYIEKNKIDLPKSYVIRRFLDDQALFFETDWDAVEKLGKEKASDYKKQKEDDTRAYVDELIGDYEKKFQKKRVINRIKDMLKGDKGDR